MLPPPLPKQTPGHLTFLKNFGQIPWYVGSWDGQMPHWLALPTTTSDYLNFSHMSKHLFKCKYPNKYNWNISNLGKLSYGGLFIWIKLFIPQSPHLAGFLKDSQMLQQNSEYTRNNPWTRCTCWMKESQNPLAWDVCDWAGLILGQSPYCTNKNAVKCPCYARGWGGGVGRFWTWVVHYVSKELVWKHLTCTQSSSRNARGGSRGYPSRH